MKRLGRRKYRAKTRNESKIKSHVDPEFMAIREQQILPVIRDLQCSDLSIRSAATQSALKLIQDQKLRKGLLREQIVKILLEQTINDSDLQAKADGWSILRGLAKEEEADFCIHLYRQDILEKLDEIIKTIIETLKSSDPLFSGLTQPQQDVIWNLTVSIVNILTFLCESHDEAVEALSKFPAVLKFLFELLALKLKPPELENEVLLCLITLTEDNEAIVEQIVANEKWFQSLVIIKDIAKISAIYACGVLHNIFSSSKCPEHYMTDKETSDAMLIPLLINHIEQFTSNEDAGHSESISGQSLQVVFEIIASIAASLQDKIDYNSQKGKKLVDSKTEELDGGDTEMETDSITGDLNDEIEADIKMVTNNESDNDELSQSTDLTLDRLIRLATPKILRIFTVKKFVSDNINERALSALNNITWTVSNIDNTSEHFAVLQKVWASLAQEIWEQVICRFLDLCTDNIELASLITSLAWAVARSVKGIVKLSPSNEDKIILLYKISRNLEQDNGSKKSNTEKLDKFQGLGVKCIGILGNLAFDPTTIDINRKIGNFLLTIVQSLPAVPAADVIESLNHIFDIYADHSYSYDESVFWTDNFCKSLEEIQSKIKKMAKSIDRRKSRELRTRADEAVLNLDRFLAYKKKEKTKILSQIIRN